MATKISFPAQARTLLGKKSQQLRRQGQIPANIMGHGIASTPVSLTRTPFARLYEQVGDNGLFYLEVAAEKEARCAQAPGANCRKEKAGIKEDAGPE